MIVEPPKLMCINTTEVEADEHLKLKFETRRNIIMVQH